ncbi:hypothetical protein [Runella sp.]|uniref:hypothetical protein n=1 Tax=Runella sp. TaxID=1960881 RepID=UPI003D114411
MRILKVRQLKPITLGGFVFPVNCCVLIDLDKVKPVAKKEHQIVYQQGRTFGTVGDYCMSFNHDKLLEMEKNGLVEITRSKSKQKGGEG